MEKKDNEVMYHEMYLQPDSLPTINGNLDGIYEVLEQVFAEKYDELILTGCGTSLCLARAAARAFSTYNAVPAKVMCHSKPYYFPENYVRDRKVPVFPITRKSYTTEVRVTIDEVRSFLGMKTLAITCSGDSILYNDYVALSPDTAEDSVIMTRSSTSMVYLVAVITMYAGGREDKIEATAGYAANAQDALKKVSDVARKIMAEHEHLKLYATLGQGVLHGTANGRMNKMKEMGLTNSEAYYTLEYRHEPMSLVDEDTLALLLGSKYTADGDSKLLIEIKSCGAVTAAISDHAFTDFADVDYTLDLPYEYNDVQNAALTGFIDQFMGYCTAEKEGLDANTLRRLSQAIVIRQKKI